MNNYEWLDEYLLTKPGAAKDYKLEWGWWRYQVGGKLFAATCQPGPQYKGYDCRELLSLKCEPLLAELLRKEYPDIIPGFYMDKRCWNSIFLDGTMPDDVLRDLCDRSYNLIFAKLTKKIQREIIGEGQAMQFIALLRGVTPTGKNRIPSMAYVAELLTDEDFHDVRTYIQSGNILLDTDFSRETTAAKIHDVILKQIGADLSVILKTREQLAVAAADNPLNEGYDVSRIHLTFTNDTVDDAKVKAIEETDFGCEKFIRGRECFYLYLPQGVTGRVLYSGYIEKRLGITTTTRKLNVVTRLCELAK